MRVGWLSFHRHVVKYFTISIIADLSRAVDVEMLYLQSWLWESVKNAWKKEPLIKEKKNLNVLLLLHVNNENKYFIN